MKIVEKPLVHNSSRTRLVYELEPGEKFGSLTVIKRSSKKAPNGVDLWETKCLCGNVTLSRTGDLMSGVKKSCGCFRQIIQVQNGKDRLIDMAGHRYGMLSVISRANNPYGGKDAYWNCICDCGNHFIGSGLEIRIGRTKSCGCKRAGVDLTGKVFSEWTVLEREEKMKGMRSLWVCKCSCGTYKSLPSDTLLRGRSKSCGGSSHFSIKGEIFGHWVVKEKSSAKDYWVCTCVCGIDKNVHISSLRSGKSKSCGCQRTKFKTVIDLSINQTNQLKLNGIANFENSLEHELIEKWISKERGGQVFGNKNDQELLDFIQKIISESHITKHFLGSKDSFDELISTVFVELKTEVLLTGKYSFDEGYYTAFAKYIVKKFIFELSKNSTKPHLKNISIPLSINTRCVQAFEHFMKNIDYLWNNQTIQEKYSRSNIYVFDFPIKIRSYASASKDLDVASMSFSSILTSINYHCKNARPIGIRFTSIRHLNDGIFHLYFTGILFVNPDRYRQHHEKFIESLWTKKNGLPPVFIRRYTFSETENIKNALRGKLKKIKTDIPFFIWNQFRTKQAYSISTKIREIEILRLFPASVRKLTNEWPVLQ